MFRLCKIALATSAATLLLPAAVPPGRSEETALKVLDIRDPGSDLANYPNSAYTLNQGQFYLETAPVFYTGPSSRTAAQYNAEYLLRYGVLDRWELRLYSQGFSVQGNPNPAVGFSPLTFDTKIHLWEQREDYFLPAAGLEITLQTTWLASPAFKGGTEPSVSLNLDKDLPGELELEINVGVARFQDPDDLSERVWDYTLSWALQREVYKDIDVFLNAYHNAGNLPRATRLADKIQTVCLTPSCAAGESVQQSEPYTQHALGGGVLWTLNDHWSVFGNAMAGLTGQTPSVQAYMGFAWMP